MSDPVTNKDAAAEQAASKTDVPKATDDKTLPQQQTGPGPKVLLSHYRGMPKQWEKNKHLRDPKKEDAKEEDPKKEGE